MHVLCWQAPCVWPPVRALTETGGGSGGLASERPALLGPSVFLENQAVERFEKDLHSTGGNARVGGIQGSSAEQCVRARVRVRVRVRVHVCVFMHARVHMHVCCTRVHVRVCMCTFVVCTCVGACVFMRVRVVCTYTCACVCTRACVCL